MDIIPTCRACLKTSLSYIDMETLFDQNVIGIRLAIQPDSFTTFMDCFRACTQLKDTDCEDQMPHSLCEQCGLELAIAWNFLQKAFISDQILRDTESKLKNVCNDSEFIIPITVPAMEKVKEFTGENSDVEDNKREMSKNEKYSSDNFNEVNEHEQLSVTRSLDVPQNGAKESVSTLKTPSYILTDEEYFVLEIIGNNNQTEPEEITIGQRHSAEKILFKNDNKYSVETTNDLDKKEISALYHCNTCLQTFESYQSFSNHSCNTLIKGTENVCNICNEPINKETMSEHFKKSIIHSNIQCTQCHYQCSAYNMSEHVNRAHTEPRNFACDICDKTFVSGSVLNSHLKYHQRKKANIKSEACIICGKRFSTQHYLRVHMEVHQDERQQHQCDYCDKIYVSKIAFENHIRLHRGETIKCDQCDKQFVRQYELNVHMRFHTRDYPFKCEICDRKFAIKGHLRTHMWRHQGLKLQCEECGKLFTSTKALQEHSFVHSEMPFPCSYCGRGYPSKQKFKVHLKTAHLVELTDDEILKITKVQTRKPLQRKKLTLVQADSVMKEIEVKYNEEEDTNVQMPSKRKRKWWRKNIAGYEYVVLSIFHLLLRN